MEKIKKLVFGLKALDLARIGDQTMGGYVALEEPLEAGVEYAVMWDGIRHDIKCEEKDGKLRLAYEPPKHGGKHEPFEIVADGTTAYVTCRSMNPDVSIAIMEEVKPNAGGASSWNDLEDKPFYADTTVIEWDGNTEGLTCVGGVFYKVSDLTPTFDEIAKATIGEVFEGTYEEYPAALQIEDGAAPNEGTVFAFGDRVIVALEDGAFLGAFGDGLTFPEAGVYFCKFEEENTFTKLLSWGEVKRLDGNFLPWLKFVCDGENYAANMTYAEAVALMEQGSLLGCSVSDENGNVHAMVYIHPDDGSIVANSYDDKLLTFSENGEIVFSAGR